MTKVKTSMNLEENVAGALCYVLGWLTGIIFYILEKDNKFVRFHAMQSIIVFLPLFIITLIFQWIPFIGWIISGLIGLLMLVLWLVLMLKAYQGEKFKLPVVGDIAEKQV
jgi:uncharacterized membrane protein